METNNPNNFQQQPVQQAPVQQPVQQAPVQQPAQQAPVQQPVQQAPQFTPAAAPTTPSFNPAPAAAPTTPSFNPVPAATPTVPTFTAPEPKKKPELNSTEKSLKKITILLIAVLVFNAVSLGIMFFFGGNNALSASEVMATIDNLYEYAYDTGDDCIEIQNFKFTDDHVSFTIKSTADETLPGGIVLLECVNSKDEVISLLPISFATLEAGKDREVEYPVYNDEAKDVRVKHVLTILPSDSELLTDLSVEF